MACIQSDGTLSSAAQAILSLVEDETPPETIAQRLERPLYAVRASLRELSGAGLVSESDGVFAITSAGLARVADSPEGS